ncbi:MAG: hypothetical protein A2Y77_18125 [Planctomycetes bacterium RBG_13_62_9]|nr:MAG: hypothetical protein A2Y77_18125 [Planctomycetes bacterium RBG_13_62_9]
MGNMQETKIVLPTPGQLLTPGVTLLLVLAGAGFLGLTFFRDAALDLLGLTPQGILHGRVWQLVTYPFLNGAWGLVFNGVIIVFVGSAIEREWRTASLLWLWLAVTVGCGVLWVLVNLILGRPTVGFGAGAGAFGFIAVMGVLFRGRRFLVFVTTIEGQHLALGLIAIGIILSLPAPVNLVWVVGALIGYLYVKARWSLGARGSIRHNPRQSGGRGQFVDVD